jgi:hypothetical protein
MIATSPSNNNITAINVWYNIIVGEEIPTGRGSHERRRNPATPRRTC